MTDTALSYAVALFSEIIAVDQLARNQMARALPKGMELSHFSVLNHLVHLSEERTPAQLAHSFHLTRGAMTNTLSKLEWAGLIHIRPDWDDARRKLVRISPAGRAARDAALVAIAPVVGSFVEGISGEEMRQTLRLLRLMRARLETPEPGKAEAGKTAPAKAAPEKPSAAE